MASESDRKKRIMEHLARSSGEFIKRPTSTMSDQRKQQIRDHIQRTSG
jgi:dephospho-CoA kinase